MSLSSLPLSYCTNVHPGRNLAEVLVGLRQYTVPVRQAFGHPLAAGSIEDGVIACSLHQYQFALADGRLLRATEEPCRGLRVFDVVYAGNEVGVMLEE